MGVFEAWQAGKQIQYQKSNGVWEDCTRNIPGWYSNMQYREKPEPEYLVGRHYVACLEGYGIRSHTAGIVRYEGYGLFSRHKTALQVPKEVFAWINPTPIELVKE